MVVITAAVALAAYIFYSSTKVDKGDDSESENEDDVVESAQTALELPIMGEQTAPAGEEKAAIADHTAAEHKALFDNALSKADKLAKGQRYVQAAASYSEAISIVQSGAARFDAKTSSSHLLVLHNNRSAMCEKAGEEQFPQALQDIQQVLSLDNKHKKARARRARILEARGQLQEALVDYTIHFMLEQLDQSPTQAPASGAKVDELGKLIAVQNASQGPLRGREKSPLPTKSFCRKCVELFPSAALWSEKFKTSSPAEQIQIYDAAPPENNLAELMDAVTCAISHGAFHTAFKLLHKPAHVLPAQQPQMQPLLALQKRLIGMKNQLQRDMSGAVMCYKESLAFEPDSLESVLMLACRYVCSRE